MPSPYWLALATAAVLSTPALATPGPLRATAAPEDEFSGKWRFTMVTGVGKFVLHLDLVQRGDSVTGKVTSELGAGEVRQGRVHKGAVGFVIDLVVGQQRFSLRATGKLAGDTAAGEGDNPEYGPFTWTATREPDA